MNVVLKTFFLVSALMLFYTYAGYPLYLHFRRRWRTQPVRKDSMWPSVSVVIAVRNEERSLPAKLDLLKDINYPPDKYEIVVASDGSTDNTNELLSNRASNSVHPVLLPVLLTEHRGKSMALNAAVKVSSGEILVLMDTRQAVHPDCIIELVRNFADESVGCVSGELILTSSRRNQSDNQGLYWRIEKIVRKLESETGSVIGVTGALYAVRRELMPVLPEATILDDVYVPMCVIRSGYRVVFDADAIAWDEPTANVRHELRRKVRTLTGNYQLLHLLPWLMHPTNPVRFEFVSHKILRLLTPFALVVLLFTSAALPSTIFKISFLAQIIFYLLGFLAPFTRQRASRAALTFLLLNFAAAIAFVNVVTRRKAVWGR